jgi:hypothetical protein
VHCAYRHSASALAVASVAGNGSVPWPSSAIAAGTLARRDRLARNRIGEVRPYWALGPPLDSPHEAARSISWNASPSIDRLAPMGRPAAPHGPLLPLFSSA